MGDIVYVNVELNQSTGEYRQPLAGEINYTSPIVDRAGDYYAAVVRLSAPLDLPVWLPQMQLGGVTPGNTVYRVSILLGNDPAVADKFGTSILNINNIPTRANVPVFTIQPSDLSNAIYSPLDVCRIFNKSFTAAFALITTAAGRPVNAMPPVMYYESSTDSLGIYLSDCRSYAANAPIEERLSVYFSASLLNYVKTFPVKINNVHPSRSAAENYMDIQLITDNLSDGTVALSIPSVNPFAIAKDDGPFYSLGLYQNEVNTNKAIYNPPDAPAAGTNLALSNIRSSVNGSFTDAFNAVNAVRVNSSGLLQTNEIGATPGTSSRTSHNLTSANSPVLQDFIPNQTQGWNRRMLLYTADSVITGARFVELNGNSSISKFSISLSWLDVWGDSHNLYSQSQSNNASVKIAFAKKSLFRL